jgi:hypothetical protein
LEKIDFILKGFNLCFKILFWLYGSNEILLATIRIRKKIVRKTKRVFLYEKLILALGNGLAPIQAIGLPILPTTQSIMRSIHSNAGLSKKAIIAQVLQDIPAKIVFTKREMYQFYDLSITQEEFQQEFSITINKIKTLRAGDFIEDVVIVASVVCVVGIIIVAINPPVSGFQPNTRTIIPPRILIWHFQTRTAV